MADNPFNGIPSLQPPKPTQVMLGPDGSVADIPVERVQEAIKGGYKVSLEMSAPDGKDATIPVDQAHQAITEGGYKPKGAGSGMETSMLPGAVRGATSLLPLAGATAGGILAAPETYGVGTMAGAGLGGAVGESAHIGLNNLLFGDGVPNYSTQGLKQTGKAGLDYAESEAGGQILAGVTPSVIRGGKAIINKATDLVKYDPAVLHDAITDSADEAVNLLKAPEATAGAAPNGAPAANGPKEPLFKPDDPSKWLYSTTPTPEGPRTELDNRMKQYGYEPFPLEGWDEEVEGPMHPDTKAVYNHDYAGSSVEIRHDGSWIWRQGGGLPFESINPLEPPTGGDHYLAGGTEKELEEYLKSIHEPAEPAATPTPTPAATPTPNKATAPVLATPRQAFAKAGDQLISRAKGFYAQIDQASGGEWSANESALQNITQKLQDTSGTLGEDAELNLLSKKIRLEWQQNQLLDRMGQEGVSQDVIDAAKGHYKQGSALYDIDAAIKSSTPIGSGTNPLSKVPERVDPHKLLPKIERLYNSGRLQQALGEEGANKFHLAVQKADIRQRAVAYNHKVLGTVAKGAEFSAGAFATGSLMYKLLHVFTGE